MTAKARALKAGTDAAAAPWFAREPAAARFLVAKPYYPWLVVAVACLAAFAGQVDASIVQLALPDLERAFDARLSSVSWVAVGYVLAFAAALPVFARLAEIAGRKRMYLAGFALFGLASALCGLAPSLSWLIAFRILQGASGALLGANSIVIVVTAVGPARRSRAMGWIAAAQAVGVSLGPAAGGFLLSSLSWHWVFWVTVPFALVGTVIGWLVVPVTPRRPPDGAFPGAAFDVIGALLLVPALASLMLAVTHIAAWGVLSTWTLGCVATAAVLLAGFVRRERRAAAPLIDLRLFAVAPFAAGAVGIVLSYALLYGMFFAIAFALVRGYHEAPLAAGLRLAIVPIALGLIAPFSGPLADRRPRLIMLGGMALCAVSALALAPLMTGTPGSLPGVMAALACFGAGLGLFIAPNNSATISAAPAERAGQAGGLLNLMRAFGTGLGVAAASSVLTWRLDLSTGSAGRTIGAAEPVLLAAIGDVLLMLATLAILAGATALIRPGGIARRVTPKLGGAASPARP